MLAAPRLAARSSMLAMALALATSAAAQPSFNAPDPTVVSGTVTFDRGRTTPGTETYTVGSSTAVLDFRPTGGQGSDPINFQNAGTTAVFQNTPSNPNFTVLNRILPTNAASPVAFNGRIVSQLQTAAGTVRGGTVWFYSPAGIVVGDGAVFDIGNLLLTTGDPTGGTGRITTGTSFTAASGPNGIVNILSGARINATAEGSYIALVAPTVLSRGTISVNGSAAFVAAETATVSFNQGLFDINVAVGSSAGGGFPLQLRGTITGPASTGATDVQAIYAVAVPKNDAITMIVAPDGNLGFQTATGAVVENGAIYLQAGGNLRINPALPVRSRIVDVPQSAANANISLTGAVTSALVAQASGNVAVSGALSAPSVTLAATRGTVTSSAIQAPSGITLAGGGGVMADGALTSASRIAVSSTSGALSLGNVETTGSSVALMAQGSLGVGNVRAAGSIALMAGATINAGDLTAGTGPLTDASGGGGVIGSDGVPVTGGIASGFDAAAIQRCDDCFTGAVPLSFGINYFGNSYTTAFVSNNGYLTFNSGQGTFTPGGLGTGYAGQPIIAAFFADVDTRALASAQATYGTGTYAGRPAFGATWNGVGYFSSQADKLNNFQIVLTDRSDTGAGNFDIYYNYTNISWETGSASSGVNGFGGTSAAVGYNAGVTGNPSGTFFELPGSRVPGSFLNGGPAALVSNTNDGVPGQLLFNVRNGAVIAPTSGPATITVSNIGSDRAAADIVTGNLSAELVDIDGSGRVTVGTVTVADAPNAGASENLTLRASIDGATGISAGAVNAGSVRFLSSAGDIMTSAVGSAGSVVLDASTNLQMAGGNAGDLVLIARNGSATATASLTASGNAIILGRSGITTQAVGGGRGASQGVYLADAINATRLGADYVVPAGFFDAAGTAIAAPVQANGALSGGIVQVTGGAGVTLTGIDAATRARLQAGLLSLSGATTAPSIATFSNDIALATGATLGGSGTQSLTINAVSTTTPVLIGGTAADRMQGSFVLDQAEIAQLRGVGITIAQQGTPPGDAQLIVRNLTLVGSGGSQGTANLTSGDGSFTVTSPGSIRVTGAVQLTNAGSANTLAFTAADSFDLVTDTGSVGALAGDGALGGRLLIRANDISVANAALFSLGETVDIDTVNPTAAIAAIGAPSGQNRPEGYVQAGRLELTARDFIVIQNSGTADTAGGFSAGSGGMLLTSLGSVTDPLAVAIYGRVAATAPATGFLTNASTRGAVSVAGGGTELVPRAGFATFSVVNGCALDPGVSCGGALAQQVAVIGPNVSDLIGALDLQVAAFPDVRLASAIDESALTTDTVVTDPVASGGNQSLWEGGEDAVAPTTPPDDERRRRRQPRGDRR